MNLKEADGPNYERDEIIMLKQEKSQRKATHKGHCQACGSVQRLPNGKLSNHGYTTKWGFFNGICSGSKELPFEKSCALVEKFIEHALSEKSILHAQIKELREYKGNLGWHKAYFNGEYTWKQLEITQEDVDSNMFKDQNGKKCYFTTYSYHGNDVESIVKRMNESRIYFLQQTIKRVDEYIEWQNERVKNWTEKDLIEIK